MGSKYKIAGGPKTISELIRYQDPFTGEPKLLHPSKWKRYVIQEAKQYPLAVLATIHQSTKDPVVREALGSIIIYHHNSIVQ